MGWHFTCKEESFVPTHAHLFEFAISITRLQCSLQWLRHILCLAVGMDVWMLGWMSGWMSRWMDVCAGVMLLEMSLKGATLRVLIWTINEHTYVNICIHTKNLKEITKTSTKHYIGGKISQQERGLPACPHMPRLRKQKSLTLHTSSTSQS